jgi:hypothetical protein
MISVLKNKTKSKIGWTVLARFNISLHKKDLELLKNIQSCLEGVGSISLRKTTNVVDYTVGSVGDLVNVVIPFFKKYPLITRKYADFKLFSQIVE